MDNNFVTAAKTLADDWYLVEQARKQNSLRQDQVESANNLAKRINTEIIMPLCTEIERLRVEVDCLEQANDNLRDALGWKVQEA